jgi:transcriptional regulator with XRE-family HTH domain
MRGLRAHLTQGQLAHKLKCKPSQIYRWETGKANLDWKDFIRLCEVRGLPLFCALQKAFYYTKKDCSAPSLVSYLMMIETRAPVSAILKKPSRVTLSRWLNGEREPSLSQILNLAEFQGFTLNYFLKELLGESFQERSLNEQTQIEKKLCLLYFKYPWIALLMRLLETHEYNELQKGHREFLLLHLGVSEEPLNLICQELEDLGVLVREGHKLRCVKKFFIPKGSPQEEIDMRKFWMKRALVELENLTELPPNQVWGYKVYSINENDLIEVREAYLDFYFKIDRILQSKKYTTGKNKICLLNVQLFELYR